jgi:hypothetical protein
LTALLRSASVLVFLLACTLKAQTAPPASFRPDPVPDTADEAVPAAIPAKGGGRGAPPPWERSLEGFAWAVGATVLPVTMGAYLLENTETPEGVGAILILGGLLGGPSAGQYALGSPIQGTVAGLVRTAGAVAFVAGLAQALGSAFCGMDFSGEGDDDCSDGDDGESAVVVGGVLYLGATAYSLIDIPFAARREQSRALRIGFGPFLRPAFGGPSQGVRAWVRF